MQTARGPGPIEILLVEDNPADIRLTIEGFKEAKIANNLTAVMNGQEALDFLYNRGDHIDAVRPDLIVLDLNLQGISGHEVLKQIKGDPDLKTIPTVVLTSSEAESDIAKSYQLQANCCIVKPVTFEGLMSVVKAIDNFWFTVVVLP
ncbi:MAG: response regulator [Rhizobiaceae bacterium]|nr:response regulator [Rhizobiaceae bacterium]